MARMMSNPLAALVVAVCVSTAVGVEPAGAPQVAGWGTYMQNNARTGVTPDTLALPLKLLRQERHERHVNLFCFGR